MIPYLARLGISHVYFSPYLQAAPGSTHGYDVVDHARVNEELGGEAGHARLLAALRAHGLGQVIDVVPNHMSIATHLNAWWWDVLENGPSSRYASYFDVDWNPTETWLKNKVLMPILGDHYGRVLEAGEIRVARQQGAFRVTVYDKLLPAAPISLLEPLARAARRAGSDELGFLADAIGALPSPALTDPESFLRRHRDKAVVGRQLERLFAEQPAVAAAVDQVLEEINADPNQLHLLLEGQNFRLAYWKAARHDLDYRRFFDIDTLAALRMDDERVFQDTHALVLRWVREGLVDGLRIDHPDGLRDPEGYLRRLRQAAPRAWIVVEKILERGEALPDSWPVDGTTGYEFANRVTALYVDPAGEAPLGAIYEEVTGEPLPDFHELVRTRKRLVLRDLLWSDLNRLAAVFVQVGERHRRYRDYTRPQLLEVLAEVTACLPIYRTYVRPDALPLERDVEVITAAVEDARIHAADLDPDLFSFLRDLLCNRIQGELEAELLARFQQLTGPAMAKGMEDTALYCHHRLVCLNEVGGDPSLFGAGLDEFHAACQGAVHRGSRSLLTTSTHDTKRSGDVRARIALLSEVPDRWREAVLRWRELAARHRRGDWPDRPTEYLLYQTLVGAWPIDAERLTRYLEKAVREAKVHTSWTRQDAAYEEAVRGFAADLLADPAFVSELERFVGPLVPAGRTSSLGQVLLLLTAPGVPDTYQGDELWNLSLTDPDNRRPVDFARRAQLLAELEGAGPEAALARADEGLPKLWLLRQALRVRSDHPACFGPGAGYRPLRAAGPHAERLVAFVRGERVVTLAPRLVLGLRDGWGETTVPLPEGQLTNALTGERQAGGERRVADLLGRFPVALLVKEGA